VKPRKLFATGMKILDKDFDAINIEKNTFHGEWNYVIKTQNI
jgi:hypothetical protein